MRIELNRSFIVRAKGFWGPCPIWYADDATPLPRGLLGRLLFDIMCWLFERNLLYAEFVLDDIQPFKLTLDDDGVPVAREDTL